MEFTADITGYWDAHRDAEGGIYFNAIYPWPNNILIIKSLTVRSVSMRVGHTLQAEEEKELHIFCRHDSCLTLEYLSSSLPT